MRNDLLKYVLILSLLLNFSFVGAAGYTYYQRNRNPSAASKICREYPGGRCGYYDFLSAERNSLDDPDHIASTWNK